MEEQSLLQQMEYLSRKIRLLQAQQSNNSRKSTNRPADVSIKAKYWQGQTKIDNRVKHKVHNAQSSQYQFKRTSAVGATNMFSRSNSNSSTKSVLTSKLSTKAPNLCYVNPHFRLENAEKKNVEPSGAQKPAQPIKHSSTEISANVFGNASSSLNSLFNMSNRLINLTDNAPAASLRASTEESVDAYLPNGNPESKMKVHVNRLVYPSNDEAKARVLVNPKVFARLKSEIRRESPPRFTTPVSRAKVKFANSSGRKSFVAVGRNKLVRVRKVSFHVTPSRVRSHSTSKTISSLTKIAKSVCSKYKFIRNGSSGIKALPRSSRKISPFVRTKYTLDRRLNRSQRRFKNVKKYSLKYASPAARVPESNLQGIMKHKRLSAGSKSSFGNRVWAHNKSFQPTKVIITDRKLLKIGSCSTPRVRKNLRSPSSSTLLRIGGVLYKSSRNALARSKNDSKSESTPKRNVNSSVTSESRKRLKTAGGHFVHVRGHKFLMDPTGKTLKRISDASIQQKGQLRRVDLGGATFIQKTANVLIRTNTHVARSLLSHAKQRSISTLSKRMQKNNTVCKFYRQFGKCFRHEKKKCPCVHDKKHVAICKSHLHGACTKADCLLSHELIPEKMPTCEHYLQLSCTRENCPYLHIKLNAKAPLCIAFLQGYCADGLRCRKWHFNICPLFDKSGRCPKGKYCPYPHKPRKFVELRRDHMEIDVDHILRMYEDRTKLVEGRKNEKILRYFEVKHLDSEENDIAELTTDVERSDSRGSENEVSVSVTCSEGMETVLSSNTSSDDSDCTSLIAGPTRKPIGFLPSYISLN